MKQVVLSLSDEGNARLRRLARETNEGKKGALSQTAEEAFELLEKERRQKKALLKLKELANKNLKLGVGKFVREDAYYGKRFG